jgi:hypothetical protein
MGEEVGTMQIRVLEEIKMNKIKKFKAPCKCQKKKKKKEKEKRERVIIISPGSLVA